MITFEQARRKVEKAWPDYRIAPFGYESDSDWFLVLVPETAGGHLPAVSKRTGAVRWIGTYSPGYSQDRPVGDLDVLVLERPA